MGLNTKTFKNGITLDPQSADPGSPSEGQLQYADGTVRTEGLWVYKNGAWASAGGGAASDTLIKLYRANSDGLTDFTVKSADQPIPEVNGTDSLAMSVTVPTADSDALLSNDDSHKVYKFASAASSQWDAQGFSCAIPKYRRGENVALVFNYRTSETSGTPANGDWRVWIWDATNGKTSTTSSSGAKAAGATITLVSATGMAVGDKIWVGETGGTAQVTEAHILSVSGNDITISVAVTLTSGDRFVTGILNDVITASIDAATSDTNKEGETKKIYFPTLATTATVNVLFQQVTSQTDSILFVDNILLSADIMKSVPTQQIPATYKIHQFTNAATNITGEVEWNLATATITQDSHFSKYCTVSDDSANTRTKFTALQSGLIHCEFNGTLTSAGDFATIGKNGTPYVFGSSSAASQASIVSATIPVVAGDYLTFGVAQLSVNTFASRTFASGAAENLDAILTFTPLQNQSILVESVDSVVSGWTAYTPTFTSFGTVTNIVAYWRRVGNEMELRGSGTIGTVAAAVGGISLPSGYYVDTTSIPINTTTASPSHAVGLFSETGFGNQNGNLVVSTSTSTSTLYLAANLNAAANLTPSNISSYYNSSQVFSWYAKVPIAGWSSYPKPVLAFPTISYGQNAEHGHWSAHAGFGATNTKIPYFTTQNRNTISSLGVVDYSDTTNGFDFTATRRCKVTAMYQATPSGATYLDLGWSLNSTQLTTDIDAITVSDRYGVSTSQNIAGTHATSTCSLIMNPGDVLRPHTDANARSESEITLLVEPEEGQINQAAIIAQPVAWVKEVQTEGTAGGTSSSTTLHTRTLNTLEGEIAAVGVTLSANAFTLPAGKYTIEWRCPAYIANNQQSQLFNSTDSVITKDGESSYTAAADTTLTVSSGGWTGSVTKSTAFLIKQYIQNGQATNGLGTTTAAVNAANTATTDVYTVVKITRHA